MKRLFVFLILGATSALANDAPDMSCIESQDSWTRVNPVTLEPQYFNNPDRIRVREGWKVRDGILYEIFLGNQHEVGPIALVKPDDFVYSASNRLIQFDNENLMEGVTVGAYASGIEIIRIRCVKN